jgi:hypothetical protein
MICDHCRCRAIRWQFFVPVSRPVYAAEGRIRSSALRSEESVTWPPAASVPDTVDPTRFRCFDFPDEFSGTAIFREFGDSHCADSKSEKERFSVRRSDPAGLDSRCKWFHFEMQPTVRATTTVLSAAPFPEEQWTIGLLGHRANS